MTISLTRKARRVLDEIAQEMRAINNEFCQTTGAILTVISSAEPEDQRELARAMLSPTTYRFAFVHVESDLARIEQLRRRDDREAQRTSTAMCQRYAERAKAMNELASMLGTAGEHLPDAPVDS